MAKAYKKKGQKQPDTMNEIYEIIQSREYLNELWWDLISDIQEKPTYKHLKSMATHVINNTMKTFTSKSVKRNEESDWNGTLTEISIMSYILDKVISEVLHQRYEKEFEGIVKKIIEDVLENKAKEAANPVKSDSLLENIESIFNDESPRSQCKKGSDDGVSDAKKSAKDIKEGNDTPARKRGRPKKVNMQEEKTEDWKAVLKRKRGRPPIIKEKSIAESFDDKESDAESNMSFGNLSIDSVSSVHTSELSSFEDSVSICSGDEGKKKRIPLKVANEMYLQGKLSQIYYIGKRGERLKEMQNTCVPNSKDSTNIKDSSTSNVDSSSRKVLPQRIRKPNSKYNSETMLCDVKDYSSPPGSSSSSSQEEMDNKSFESPKIQRKRKRLSFGKRPASTPASKSPIAHNVSSPRNSSASKRAKTRISPLLKSSTKRYDTSDLYKPRAVAGNTIGSRSTAVTLFSS